MEDANLDKKKKLDATLQAMKKQFGAEAVMKMGESPRKVDCVPSGSLTLDYLLGIGGLPKGRIIEIYGPESSGKTTLALTAVASFQKHGLNVAYIDAEHALDPSYAEALGVNIDELVISQPDCGEQGLEIADNLIASGSVGLVVIDSVAALTPKAEIEGEMGDSHMGLQARMMSQALRKITANANKTGCTVIFINQLRMKIGVMFGNPETTTGGNALKFYASCRIEVRAGQKNLIDKEVVGTATRVKIVKNKVAPPFKEGEYITVYGKGIDKLSEMIDVASEFGIIEKSGSWYAYKENKIGQGKENARKTLEDDSKLKEEIETRVREVFAKKSQKESVSAG
jgi:recombination protein RecA